MKKRPSDIEGLIVQVQQQLTYLDKKIDTLISQVSARPSEIKQQPEHFRQPRPFQQANNYRERVLHKAICADCRKECEVPFKPTGDRPVYCKECFAKRKAGSSFKANTDNRPREEGHVQERRPSHKHARVENRKPYEKKKFTKKRKSRS